VARGAHARARGGDPLLPDVGDARLSATPGRRAAWESISAAHRGRRLDLAFAAAAADLDSRERAFAQELAFGTERLRGRWDHLLARHARGGLDRLDAEVLDVLRLGAHQLFAMEVPAFAAISSSVDLARAVGAGRASGLVNAVLRALDREGLSTESFPDRDADPAGWLATWGSHPRWLVERWLARWSVDEVERLVEADNRVPEAFLVPFDDDLEGAANALAARGIETEAEPRSRTLRLVSGSVRDALASHPLFVQDPAAALVVSHAEIPEGARVADLCAAPGGKGLSASRRAGYVLAADPSAPRLELVRENARRLGARIGIVRAVAEAPPVRDADVVLVDAPCTGTGTLRRHPDARWRLTPDAPAAMAEVQARILRGAATAVRRGGVLVYSTCTLEPEENAEVVRGFLAGTPGFVPAPPGEPLEVLPQDSGWDGAWAMRMRKE
jgi:16S rRNA (cytosine967-C5)-methyltransferase